MSFFQGINYGIIVGPIMPATPDETAFETAKKLVDTYGDGPVAYVNYGASMKFYEYVMS